jgi:hypothetical protein
MTKILELLTSLLSSSDKLKQFSPMLELLSKNNFDIASTLKNLNLDAIAPLIKVFMENLGSSKQNKTPAEFSTGEISHLNPIANLADKEIVYALNRYFA